MKFRFILRLAGTVIALLGTTWSAAMASVATERQGAATLLALGRVPTAAERVEAEAAPGATVGAQVTAWRLRLQTDGALRRATWVRATQDALGREATAEELAAAERDEPRTYAEIVERHRRWLAAEPAAYRALQDKAYRLVVGRAAFDLEYAYWAKRDALPYALLVGCIENWGRRNSPGLMVTGGQATVSMNSDFLTTLSLAPVVAGEARAALGWPGVGEELALVAAFGRNLVAPGAADVLSLGRMHFVACGNEMLRPSDTVAWDG